MKHPSLTVLLAIAAVAGAQAFAGAAPETESQSPSAAGPADGVPAPATRTKMKMKKAIKMHEPMTTPMAKPGMMKEDMNQGMARKDAEMKPMMEKEEKDMK